MPKISSPFRYPGGKSQLYPYIKHLLEINNINGTYIEPFAGGAGVAIDLLLHGDVKQIVINDYDKSIFSAWNVIINHSDELIEFLKTIPVTYDEWINQKRIHEETKSDSTSINGGLATFYLNRTNVSGIIKGGPIGGKKQTGKYKIDARFNRKKLIEKVQIISRYKEKIILMDKDANELTSIIKDNYNSKNTFIFFDPPYFAQGKNLYLSFIDSSEHLKLFNNIKKMNDFSWIVTYDTADEIKEIYNSVNQKFIYSLNYTANNRRKAQEFLFTNSNLKIESYKNIELIQL